MFEIFIAIIVAFLVVLLFTPKAIQVLKEKGLTGTDVHKPDRPEIPKGAGLVFLFAMVFSLLTILGLTTFRNFEIEMVGILAALVSILMAGLIGLMDDFLDFSNKTKIILPLIATIPMMAMSVGTPTMSIPFIGTINFGVAYALIIVPLMMTFIIDATNMYAGMNGLEAGLASINASGLIVYVLLTTLCKGTPISGEQLEATIIAGVLLGASLAFLIFNKYPAKVLMGDVGTLPIGAAIAAAFIIGNMDRLAILMYAPFAVNFVLYLLYRIYVKRKGIEWQKFATPREDGTLEVIGPFTVYWIFPYFFNNITEKRNVALLLLFQALLVYGALFLIVLGFPLGMGII